MDLSSTWYYTVQEVPKHSQVYIPTHQTVPTIGQTKLNIFTDVRVYVLPLYHNKRDWTA